MAWHSPQQAVDSVVSVLCCYPGRGRIKASINCPKTGLSSAFTMVNGSGFAVPGGGGTRLWQCSVRRVSRLQKGRRRQCDVFGSSNIEDMDDLVGKHALRRGMIVPQFEKGTSIRSENNIFLEKSRSLSQRCKSFSLDWVVICGLSAGTNSL